MKADDLRLQRRKLRLTHGAILEREAVGGQAEVAPGGAVPGLRLALLQETSETLQRRLLAARRLACAPLSSPSSPASLSASCSRATAASSPSSNARPSIPSEPSLSRSPPASLPASLPPA